MLQSWGSRQSNASYSLAGRAVEQDRVRRCLPDRYQFHASGAVQAKEYAAWTSAFFKDAFCELKGSDFQFVLITQLLLDKISQIRNAAYLVGLFLHRAGNSFLRIRWSGMVRPDEQAGEGVCKSKYRQDRLNSFDLKDRE